MTSQTLPLNSGAAIPAVGLGTWQSPPGEVQAAVYHALKSGYKHIDCAFMYQNEDEVGAGLKQAFDEGVCRREDVWITTKLWCSYHSRVEECLNLSLERLGLSYVDLYLMHWPVPMNPKGNHPLIPKHADGSRDLDEGWDHTKTWGLLEEVQQSGKAKNIGVCNYSVPYLEELLKTAKTVPAVNQIENHPYLPQLDVTKFCKEKGIHVTAYSPFGSTGSPLFKEDAVKSIAEKHAVGAGTVLLSYQVSRGHSVVPKSVTPKRIEENRQVVVLDKEEVAILDDLHEKKGTTRYVYPDFGVNLGFPDKPEGKTLLKKQSS